jgi:putative tryptophan/tyrosine transport system substrate-binding protein
LAETGYAEGRNVAIEYRWAEGRNDRVPAFAADLVQRRVAVIVSPANAVAALAAQAATKTIPIVFAIGTDPVEAGLVASLDHPGGNITGVSILSIDMAAKCLESLHELIPSATLIAWLFNQSNPVGAERVTRELERAARILGVRLLLLKANSEKEIEAAFEAAVQQRAGALLTMSDTFYFTQRDQILALATKHRVPTLTQYLDDVRAGGLMSYHVDLLEALRIVGSYTGRILNGEKPADLPVQQSTKIKLAINLRTAKTLGIVFPTALLLRADEVIE